MTLIRCYTDEDHKEYTMIKPSDMYYNELNLIKNTKILKYVTEVLNNDIWKDNFVRPASSTGKYHPSFAKGRYGLVKHTKALVKLLTVMQNAYPNLNWDCIYAAAILHDMYKYSPNKKYTNSNHADLMADKILRDCDYNTEISKELFRISIIVRYHMGRFDNHIYKVPDEKVDDDMFQEVNLVHIADMISSRNWYGTDDVILGGK